MSDMRLMVAGAGGRMGRTLIKAISESKGMKLAGALEDARSPLMGWDAGTLAGLGENHVKLTGDPDKIIGEVRNVVFGTKDRRDYAIVAAGGFFTPGKDSIVVPIRFLNVSQDRDSFYLSIAEAKVKAVPLMPDQDYRWLADDLWRARNDALFGQP